MKGKFLGTFILSILSAAFGVAKFVKNGPMNLVPRESYGPSFVLGTFFVAGNLVYKGLMLGASFSSTDPISAIFTWISAFLLPQFVYAMVLALAAFGFRKTLMLFFRFPGAILLPMFTPLTFGPVIGSCSSCCCCSRTAGECDCKLTKSPMELSFTFSYVNVVISAIGGVIFFIVLQRDSVDHILSIILPAFVLQLVFIGIFHLFEKRCLCCCNFCFPFTKRETFDIGDAPAWGDAMTDLSHLYQNTPDVMVEGEAIELENLVQVVINENEPIPEAVIEYTVPDIRVNPEPTDPNNPKDISAILATEVAEGPKIWGARYE